MYTRGLEEEPSSRKKKLKYLQVSRRKKGKWQLPREEAVEG
jgi:hypothetical protein